MNMADRMQPSGDTILEENLLLRSLRKADRDLLLPYLEPHEYGRGEVIFSAGSDVGFITFPYARTIVTLVVSMMDGRSAETATIGREGAVGAVVSSGGLPASTHAVVWTGGSVLRLESVRLQAAKRRSETLRNLFSRYADCLLAQVLQSAACASLHTIEERTLRFLLSLHDRLDDAVLPITQETLASMLGVQRTYLTRILNSLQRQGLIEVGRGRISIADRHAMAAVACECHASIRRHFDSVLGAVYSPQGGFVAFTPHVTTDAPHAHNDVPARVDTDR